MLSVGMSLFLHIAFLILFGFLYYIMTRYFFRLDSFTRKLIVLLMASIYLFLTPNILPDEWIYEPNTTTLIPAYILYQKITYIISTLMTLLFIMGLVSNILKKAR